MTSALHHIRLLAGFEVEPGIPGQRQLERDPCERLAAALADDLARQVPSANSAMLVVGGSLLEPHELLRPGWPAWEALSDLARPVIRERGASGQVLAIGTHQGRLPDARLRGDEGIAGGQFLAIPMLLISDQPLDDLRRTLEEKLFESGGVHPPARSALTEATAIDTVHGQLLTLTDLIALQHVQMDTAGLGGFWPVVEQVLLEPERNAHFDLPARLQAEWLAEAGQVNVTFMSLDQYDGHGDDYALWLRALRSLCALLDAHRMVWQAVTALDLDPDGGFVTETFDHIQGENELHEQHHPDCGLVAWSLVENGCQRNFYPLSSNGLQSLARSFAERGLSAGRKQLDQTTSSLKAALST